MSWPDPLHLFLRQVASGPDRPAVVTDERTVSYRELAELAARFAAAFHARVAAGPKVLIHLPQVAEAYAAMFGSLMAGGIYAPANLSSPHLRQRALLDSFEPDIVVSSDDLAPQLGLAADDERLVRLDGLPAGDIRRAWPAHDLAYVMFTSGSTGVPKGVMIPRQGLAHYANWAVEAMAVRPDDRWSQHPNLGFDLSVLDIYGALCAGAALFPISTPRDRLLPGDVIRRHGLTIWNSVPSVIDLMARAKQVTARHFQSLRLLTFCGEPLLQGHLNTIFQARPDVTVHNTYGPTEATVSFTLSRLTAANFRDSCRASAALGDPIADMHLWLDGDSPDAGEIVIGGPQVARGYWRDPPRTQAAFGTTQDNGGDIATYRTGDWGVRHNGQVYFQGRIDRQVKIHGHRLELAEVDSALRACGAVAACTVLWEGQLHSFVEAATPLDAIGLKRDLALRLPGYAMPAHIHEIAAIPRSANDKIDSGALLEILGDAHDKPSTAGRSDLHDAPAVR